MKWVWGDRSIDFSGRTQIMGILNVTPDSFYDGGRYADSQSAVAKGWALEEEGADIIDIGGESSRPPMYGKAEQLTWEEECRRVVPIIEGVRRRSQIPISIDTTKAAVARRALEAGADIINDISALAADDAMGEVAVRHGASVILMHRRGTSDTMQCDTHYDNLVDEISCHLEERIGHACNCGIEPGRIAVDPGLGFGKSVAGNLCLINQLEAFVGLGFPVLVGASRKSFIWKSTGTDVENALEGSLAAAVLCVIKGCHMLRVHDVAATVRAVRLAEAVLGGGAGNSQ
ncbi:MAG: dihydropteroate synthase [Candidatus Latescibacteria bacterium]|nr:dihydropteroate synthase [Candidatus Latescibacterota bacterium]